MTTGKTTALARQTFVGKVMSLLSRLVIAYFPRSKRLLISWLQSPSVVILEPRKGLEVLPKTLHFSSKVSQETEDLMPALLFETPNQASDANYVASR